MAINFKFTYPLIALFILSGCGKDEGYSLLSVGVTRKIFVTAATTTGNIGGVAGADAKCMADGVYPGTGTYKALIVDGTSRVACTTNNCAGGGSCTTSVSLSASSSSQKMCVGTYT